MSIKEYIVNNGYNVSYEIPSIGVNYSILMIGNIAMIKIDLNAEIISIVAFRETDSNGENIKKIVEAYEKSMMTNFTVNLSYI